jgi:hypothetical protein
LSGLSPGGETQRAAATGQSGAGRAYSASEVSFTHSEINSENIRNSRVRNRQAFEDSGTRSISTSPRSGSEAHDRKRRRTSKTHTGTRGSPSAASITANSHRLHSRADGSTAVIARAMRLTSEHDPDQSLLPHTDPNGALAPLDALGGGSLGGIRPIQSEAIADPYAPGPLLHSTASNDEVYPSAKNAHAKGLSNGSTNGSATNGSLSPRLELFADSAIRRPMTISRVSPPGSTLYPDSTTNREEFVRLVIQTMKDIGYLYVF